MISTQEKKRLWLLPNYIGIKHPDAWLPSYYLEKIRKIPFIFCESYKSADALLDRQGMEGVELYEINEHTKWRKSEGEIQQFLLQYSEIGLLSDAGLPCLADPGENIVQMARELGFEIKTLPGPNSMMLALIASGLNAEQFTFHGYLHTDAKKRNEELQNIRQQIDQTGYSQIIMETPYRNFALFENMVNRLPNTLHLSISLDLLGRNEDTKCQTIEEWKNFTSAKQWMHKTPAVFVLGKLTKN